MYAQQWTMGKTISLRMMGTLRMSFHRLQQVCFPSFKYWLARILVKIMYAYIRD